MKCIDRLPPDVKKEIRIAVENELERYHIYKYTLFHDREVNITTVISDTPKSFTGTTSDQTSNVAVYNVDEPARRRAFCDRLEKAVEQLPHRERFLITERYMKRDMPFDYAVYSLLMDPPVTEATYAKLKNKAMALLALMLNLQIDGLKQLG
ncbi:ArpU family phage packaging/lysis transcriptional regulator [Paenibacillus sp. EC2-1]|uniref:ArpU family phage packaging/lysis transcriptional regulator n=1 Tax=Paenibacillus sp. EC2-1 TaxID=3388665 RepID=UPI003BEEB049